jgi:aminoglycoside phosphotransferase (APT) family kinase protein
MSVMKEERITPLVEDIEGTRQKLMAWFSQRIGSDVHIGDLSIPQATGMSNVTLLFTITYQQGNKTINQDCVGRLSPDIEYPVFPAYDLSLQYRVMDIIGSQTEVPAPPLLGLEMDTSVLGTPFYIMEKIDGRIPGDMPPYTMGGWMMEDINVDQRAALWNASIKTMATLHRQDYQALGFDFLFDAGKTPLQQQLDYWEHYRDWGLQGHPCPIAEEALDWLKENQPPNEPTALCWGDSRLGNLIISEDCQSINAVLDWEMAVLGNPLQDLAWWNYHDRCFSEALGMPRLEGLPGFDDTIALWEKESGLSAEHYHYYSVFAGMRYGLIMSRVMLATGQAEQIADNFVLSLLQKVIDEN